MLRTFNHEFTHFLEKHNPAEYNELRQAVFDVLREHGEDVDALILQKQGEDENGKPLMSYDAASREVAAEALTDILPDTNFVEVLAQRHKNVFELLLDKLKEFVESIREYFAELTPNKDKGANALKEEVDGALHYMESIVKLFDKVAVNAVENYQASVTADENVVDGNNDHDITQAQPRPHSDEIGDDNHGSADTELLEGREISASDRGGNGLRKQGANSEKLAGYLGILGTDEGQVSTEHRAGESGWLVRQKNSQSSEGRHTASILRAVSRIELSNRDTVGRKVGSEISKNFKDTVFKDKNGNLLSLYHWTTATFDQFAKGEFGFHLGTLESAHDRYLQTKEEQSTTPIGIYKEVYANITNPIELRDDGSWDAGWVAYQLVEKEIISEQQYDRLSITEGFYDNTYDNPAAEAVRGILAQYGYDGIVYKNDSEDVGSYSVIALYPDQIITVAENGILKEGTGITEPSSNEGLVQSQSREYLNSSKNAKHKKYSYEWFTNKPDMAITTLDSQAPSTRADIIKQAKKNAAIIGTTNNDGSVSVHVYDNGADVLLGTDGLKHGLRRSAGIESDINSTVALKAGEIIQNSIQINEITPSKEDASKSYVLIGAARGTNGEDYIVRFVVNQFNNELASIDVLYAIKTKKELAALNAPRFTAKPLSVTSSTISIAKLLENVNEYFPDVMPEDVLKHYGHSGRPDGVLGQDALYQPRTQTLSDREILEMAADELTLDDLNQGELSALNIFRSRLDKLRHLQQ